MPRKRVALDEMQEAVTPTGPAGADSPSFEDGWGLHPEAISAARSEDENGLATVLGREGLGGRIAARLLIAVVQAERAHRELAEELSALTERTQRADRHLQALKSMAPTTPDEATKRADAIDHATKDWSHNLNRKGKSEVATSYLDWLHSAFPALFGREPQILRGEPRIFGQIPPEVAGWFSENEVEPNEFNSWQQIGRAPARRRRRIITTVAAVNRPKE